MLLWVVVILAVVVVVVVMVVVPPSHSLRTSTVRLCLPLYSDLSIDMIQSDQLYHGMCI